MSYRVGMIGAGMYGSTLAAVFYSLTKTGKINFCALADIDEQVCSAAKVDYGVSVYKNYKDMIDHEQLDAIAIVTPDYLHEEMAVYAAKHKLHMLVQKPLDVSTDGARRIVRAAEKNNVLLYVDFHKRFDPSFLLLRKTLQSGRLGELLYGYVNIEDSISIPSVSFRKWAHKSSPAWFIGIHMCDLLSWAIGEPPKQVLSTGQKKKLVSMGIDTWDCISTKLIYRSGASITLDSSWILPTHFPSVVNQNLRIVGTQGIIELDGQHRGVEMWLSEQSAGIPNPYGYLDSANPVSGNCCQGYTIQSLEYFVKLLEDLENGTALEQLPQNYPNGTDAILATRVVEAIHQSLITSETVLV